MLNFIIMGLSSLALHQPNPVKYAFYNVWKWTAAVLCGPKS